jgi:hypothetical protein
MGRKSAGRGALLGAPLFMSVEYAEQVQKDDDKDRYPSEPEDDVAEHGKTSFRWLA